MPAYRFKCSCVFSVRMDEGFQMTATLSYARLFLCVNYLSISCILTRTDESHFW